MPQFLSRLEDWAPRTTPRTTPKTSPKTSPRTTLRTTPRTTTTSLTALVPSPHPMSGQNMSMLGEETNNTIREVLALVGVITCVIIWSGLMRLVKWGRRKVRYCFSNFFK